MALSETEDASASVTEASGGWASGATSCAMAAKEVKKKARTTRINVLCMGTSRREFFQRIPGHTTIRRQESMQNTLDAKALGAERVAR
jgi:hypothetical protein